MPDNPVARAAATGSGELLLYGLTPPPAEQLPGKIAAAAQRTRERLVRMGVDAVVVYDLVDEPGRSEKARPFPFTPTIAPRDYVRQHLADLAVPPVLYRNVGSDTEDELRHWLRELPDQALIVLVGAASADTPVRLDLPRAQQITREHRPDVVLGAVTIAERHTAKGDEHERLLRKQESGCAFFVSQVVYDAEPACRLARDYAATLTRAGTRPAPLLFALSMCGSAKQLDLMEWLGIAVPEEVARRLRDGDDPRAVSAEHCLEVARHLAETCRGLGLPFGFVIESISDLRKDVDATMELAADVAALLRR